MSVLGCLGFWFWFWGSGASGLGIQWFKRGLEGHRRVLSDRVAAVNPTPPPSHEPPRLHNSGFAARDRTEV